ncbi:Predicted membrane protein (DUF2306) [Seminavis robusta]|uniref:Predicted membrane protein (DUF2306) n=1 Tax=Seminavis robusta TaxID=568900 RepID=A0A9N8DFL2_9STRA|nr:Predicted membrane protein (DUF2306) [Seminavis robusta]|eukprot:Sro45_g027050.1 Predicted membrane protein (DUF2306) (330) ;mRNA; f:99616-100605
MEKVVVEDTAMPMSNRHHHTADDDNDAIMNVTETTPILSTATTSTVTFTPLFRLTALAWCSTISFALFALFQYVLPAITSTIRNDGNYQQRWEQTDPGLYRSGKTSTANGLMVVHMMGGIFLMLAGPIQLIPWMRKNKRLQYHRWIGRVYLLAALTASCGATTFVLLFRTSRLWIHEDIQNVLFGLAVIACSLQSYRYIAIPSQKDIQLHKFWSWSLVGFIFTGAPLYRICSWPIYILATNVLPPVGNITPHPIISASFYCIFLPLILSMILYKYRHNHHQSWKPDTGVLNGALAMLLVLWLPLLMFTWIPAIFDRPTTNATTEMKIDA